MLQELIDSNPAREWIKLRRQVELRLTNGHLIVVRYDGHTPANFFNSDNITKQYGFAVGEREIAATIADVLNQKIALVNNEVKAQVDVSFLLLEVLINKNYKEAEQLAIRLGESLLAYEPAGTQVWGIWLNNVVSFIKRANEPKSSLVAPKILKELDIIIILIIGALAMGAWIWLSFFMVQG